MNECPEVQSEDNAVVLLEHCPMCGRKVHDAPVQVFRGILYGGLAVLALIGLALLGLFIIVAIGSYYGL